METSDENTDIVHPEVRAHINSLVSALGGVNFEEDGVYQLGDDALEVLRDIKRWIRFYDEKTNRMDVARCVYEANLIEGDLLPILSLWPDNAMDNKFRARIALACFEVMVPLTWPMERNRETMTVNHHRHMPVLELAQVEYKRAIINFDGAHLLQTAARVALPSMAIPIGDRTARDQGIIKLVLFFLRNMVMITPPRHVKYDGDESQISRSALIDALSYQDIFHLLLTLASSMGEEFKTEDTTVMEIIFHLVKRVDISKLFMNEQQLHKAKGSELSAMMTKESAMLKSYNRKGPTRHNRFGTMIWVQRNDGKMSSLSGQDALADSEILQRRLDSSKTFKPPRRSRKEDKDVRDLGPPAKLDARANRQLRSFVEDFLDSGFNPLFQHTRKTLDREAPHVMQFHRRQFFYIVSWFLEAQRARRKSNQQDKSQTADDAGSFNLVAGVLNQEMFITLNKALHDAYEYKEWPELTAVMRCFTQILLMVQDMADHGNEDDREIADNVLNRLFYEEATHDAIANIIRTYKDQGFDYLDAATEFLHHFLRILEAYSKQNVDMQVRSKRQARRKKKTAKPADSTEMSGEDNDESDEDRQEAERTVKERKFDFQRFSARFATQGVVDTFVTFLKYYQDLSDEQLKRAHRFFYRLAFKLEMGVMLFRVDIIRLMHDMIKGEQPLSKASGYYKEWEELIKQLLRRCVKKIEERPELIIELLFSKQQGIAFFLEYGYERQTTLGKANTKPGAELEFKYTEERDRQVAILIGALLDKNQTDNIAWIKGVLTNAEAQRRAWDFAHNVGVSTEATLPDDPEPLAADQLKKPAAIVVQPDDDARRTAMFKNSHLRLLMTVAGFERLGPPAEEQLETSWIIPADVSAEHLKDTLHYINQAEFSPPIFDDGVLAEDQLKRKAIPRKKAAFDDDEDGGLEDEFLFPAGGPTARKAVDEGEQPKNPRRRRRRDSDGAEVDDAALEEKARKRRDRELEKARKIKSALYVNEGDDEFDSEEDDAFFARERALAERAEKAALSALHTFDSTQDAPRKRKYQVVLDDSDSDDDEDKIGRVNKILSSQDDPEASDTDDTTVDASDGDGRKKRRLSPAESTGEASVGEEDVDIDEAPAAKIGGIQEKDDGMEEDIAPVTKRRPRVRGGFVLDSDDDE